ncbi:NADPH-dependent F420 reductase [Microbacterium sp.]|uniref:NADPH-dependent F420 reductase n=1 Tax=Microbacterium sp. TaxID=51671 RepID=UPI0039E2BFC4
MTTVGIIGAGHIGSALAEGLAARGYDVVIANSRGPESLADLVARLGPGVRAATATEAAHAADWAIVTVPLRALGDVPAEPLAGKIVLDTNNYYWERDGHIAALDENRATTTGLVQEHLHDSRVVKAFNHIRADEILTTGSPAGTPGRRALAIASDHADAAALAADVYDAFGFDAVDVGSVAESWRFERDRPAYVVRQDADELRENLARAQR